MKKIKNWATGIILLTCWDRGWPHAHENKTLEKHVYNYIKF